MVNNQQFQLSHTQELSLVLFVLIFFLIDRSKDMQPLSAKPSSGNIKFEYLQLRKNTIRAHCHFIPACQVILKIRPIYLPITCAVCRDAEHLDDDVRVDEAGLRRRGASGLRQALAADDLLGEGRVRSSTHIAIGMCRAYAQVWVWCRNKGECICR